MQKRCCFVVPTKQAGAGAGRPRSMSTLINGGVAHMTLNNRYVPGSGVGGLSRFARSALLKRATNKTNCACAEFALSNQ
tara:strand:- start:1031 stop:1267 length:237 start_codon:yes stop_codon:yes gene_type:complete